MQPSFDFEQPLFVFSSDGNKLPFTIRDSVAGGVAVFGATSSGKSSGPGAFLAKKYLAAGYGGCVLTTKNTDKGDWIEYARATNRLDDIIVVEPGGTAFFDFLSYEASRSKASSYTQNVAETIKVVLRADKEKTTGNNSDPFWENAIDQVIFFTLELVLLAYGRLSVQQLYDVALSAPQKGQKTEPGQRKSAFTQAIEKAQRNIDAQTTQFIDALPKTDKEKIERPENFEKMVLDGVPDVVRLKAVDQFFAETYRNLAEKTRSIVSFSWTGCLFTLMKEPIYSLFCRHTSFTPEDSWDGKIIIINLPVLEYHHAGRMVQGLFKYIWQKAMQRRKPSVDPRPVFLFIDEAQNFLNEHDASFLAVSRSSLIASVFISQSLPNYYAFMSGEGYKNEYKVKSLLANFSMKIFCCNTCVDTNRWASELIGDGYTETTSRDITVSGDFSSSRSMSYELEPMVRPELFGLLHQGGPEGFIVETIVHRQGKLFDNGHNFKKVIFKQN